MTDQNEQDSALLASVPAEVAVAPTVPRSLQAVLSPDETILLLLRPSPMYIVLSSLGTLVASAVIGLVLAYSAQFSWTQWSETHAAIFSCGLAGARLSWAWLDWINHAYALTDRRVIARRGILSTALYEAPLLRIQNTIVVQSLRERLCGLGTLGFATAGRGTFDAFWESIASPFEVHRKVLEAIQRYGGR
ncbi:MAG: PH domain-containing protein [Planctomycetota bacterium]|nr:MAG: PH domain-containing protein [Planctomycetota bacterium]RLS89483.1 MAG: PH domain-containing protein [Planctomycetota bacterium]